MAGGKRSSSRPPGVNRYGRRGGRGWRPYLLIPKVLAVATLFGSMVAAAVLLAGDDPQAGLAAGRRAVLWVTLPALGATLLAGWALLLQHPLVFWRMRWIRCKAATGTAMILALAVATTILLNPAASDPTGRRTAALIALLIAIAFAVLTIWLGRHKPRLGQNPAKKSTR